MARRDEIIQRLDGFLDIEGIADYGPNGLQVEGAPDVERVVTGVTASEALIGAAAAAKAQMVVVHHGIFWSHISPALRGSLLKRVRLLLDAGITLLAYHLPLDRHGEVGNNAPALRDFGATGLEPFALVRGIPVGWKGRFSPPIDPAALIARLRRVYDVEPTAFLEGPREIRSVGLVSGAAQGEIHTAIREKLDAFITGEISEYNFHLAREEGIHHISLGHHASERIGPRLLARWIAEHCDVEAEFIDQPNPV